MTGALCTTKDDCTEDVELTAGDLAEELAGPGVTVSNVTFTGNEQAAGLFQGDTDTVGFGEGVVLSSGFIQEVIGPNEDDSYSMYNGGGSDADLTSLSGFFTADATVLTFDFVPNAGRIKIDYVFSSEEYNEYVNSSYNDVFAFFVNGQNCAVVPGKSDAVTINNINNGNPYGDQASASNPEYYRNNDLADGGGDIATEMDGLTTALACETEVNAGETNTMKLAIADASDSAYDSNVFLKANGITTCVEDGFGPLDGTPAEGAASKIVDESVEPAAEALVPGTGDVVNTVNCGVVVPVEEALGG